MNDARLRWMRRQVALSRQHVHYSDDFAVQVFVEDEAAMFPVWGLRPDLRMSAAEIEQAAYRWFGAARCRDLKVPLH
jgi:hypothetical protein